MSDSKLNAGILTLLSSGKVSTEEMLNSCIYFMSDEDKKILLEYYDWHLGREEFHDRILPNNREKFPGKDQNNP